MKLLDFSSQEFDSLEPSSDWEMAIQSFLNDWNSDSEFIVAQTSGSTGEPKSISLPKSAMKLSAQLTGKFFGLQQSDTALLCLPVSFIAGKMMVVRAIELGLKLYCISPSSRINLAEFPELDFVPLTPMQVENSWEALPKIKTLLIGGAPLSDSLRNKLLPLETQSYESYGMTETITHIGLKKISEDFFQVLDGIGIRQDQRDCLVIQTPYFPEEIITNDLVEIRNPKEFKWLGRWDNIINSGGIKLIPEKIEQQLKPFISTEFILTSIPDEILGEKLVLVVESAEIPNLDYTPINLAKFEIPKEIYAIKEFPRTESGKLKRKEIQEILQQKTS